MFKRVPFVLVTLLVLGIMLAGTVQAQEPSGDFEVVRSRIEEWLATDPQPVVPVDTVFETLNDGDPSNDPFILSVRKPEDFAKGHVSGAVNIPWNQVAKPESLAQLPEDQQILDYCYTGHTGQIAMTTHNLLGYPADNMKWGMMAWSADDEVLALERFDPAAVPDYRVETEPNEAEETYPFPELSTGAAEEDEIVRVALDNYLSSGKAPTIAPEQVFENLNDGDDSNDPFILSVRSPEDYAKGHVPGAVNIPWLQLADPDNLAKLPSDRQIVVYCYTGHTGQIATTLLNALGYDAVNMKFGMMGWSADPDVVATTVFDPATQADYAVEQGAAEEAPVTEAAAGAEEELMQIFDELDPQMQDVLLNLARALAEMAVAE